MEHQIFIETERLFLRQWLPTDEAAYQALNADREVMEFFPSVLTAKQSSDHMQKLSANINSRGYGFFAMERKEDNTFIGFTGISHPGFEAHFTPCAEIGWRIEKKYWGQGYATEAAKGCLAFGFSTLGLTEIYSFTSIHNTRSENVMKKIGMVKENEFDHPLLADGSYLQKHILYKINAVQPLS